MVVQWPYSNIETSALSFETVRLQAVSVEAVILGKATRLSNLQTVNLDAINIEAILISLAAWWPLEEGPPDYIDGPQD